MTTESLNIIRIVDDFDAAIAAAVQLAEHHRIVEPQVLLTPTVAPPDDTHREPWSAYRVQVCGLSRAAVFVAPLPTSWPPPTGKAVGS